MAKIRRLQWTAVLALPPLGDCLNRKVPHGIKIIIIIIKVALI